MYQSCLNLYKKFDTQVRFNGAPKFSGASKSFLGAISRNGS